MTGPRMMNVPNCIYWGVILIILESEIMRRLVDIIPREIKANLKVMTWIIHFGNNRLCPVCGRSSRRFLEYGIIPRRDAKCPYCGSLERHRHIWLFLKRKTNIFFGEPRVMLHVAPEPAFQKILTLDLPGTYITADLENPYAMIKMDITKIQFPPLTFDIIMCNHVLEHIQDDIRAMEEMHRVLKDEGWAIITVPITVEKTVEDPTIVDPKERLKHFGQKDHVRRYGIDFIDRLRSVGFIVDIHRVRDLIESEEIVRMGLAEYNGVLFYCTKA